MKSNQTQAVFIYPNSSKETISTLEYISVVFNLTPLMDNDILAKTTAMWTLPLSTPSGVDPPWQLWRPPVVSLGAVQVLCDKI